MITLDLSILNQKGTPMFNSDIFANRPAAGVVGRIFISTDTYEFYRDTGSAWDLIGGSGTGTITGSGTAGTLSKFTSASSIGNSIVSETGSALTINGTAKATNWYVGTPSDLTRAFAAIGNANNVALWLEEYGNTQNSGDVFMFKGRGTESAKANIQVGDNTGAISTGGYVNGILTSTTSWFAEVVNVDTVNNQADSDWKLTQTYNSVTPVEHFRIRAADGYVVSPNGGFENVLTKTALASEGWYGLSSAEYITIPANTSFNNQGFALSTFVGANLMTYQGNATYGNGNGTTSVFGQNGFGFSSAGSTITLNQRSGGTNAFAGLTAFNYTIGSNNGTISHLAGLHVLAPYQVSSAILSVTNYYGALINASDERTAFSITNKWGIYQEGISDKNYFAANVLLGSIADNGNRLQITGNEYLSGNLAIGTTSASYRIDIQSGGGTIETIRINNGSTGVSDGTQLLLGNSANFTNAFFRLNGGGNTSQAGIGSLNIGLVESAPMAFFTGNVQRAIINGTNGNLSVGTTTTDARLRVSGIQNGTQAIFGVIDGRGLEIATSIPYGTNDAGCVLNARGGGAGVLIFETEGVNAMRILNNQRVLINSTVDSGNQLRLNGSFRIDGQTSATAGGSSGQHLIIDCDGTTYKIALLNP